MAVRNTAYATHASKHHIVLCTVVMAERDTCSPCGVVEPWRALPIGQLATHAANDNNNIKATAWELSLSGGLGPQPPAASHTRAYMVHDTFLHLDSQPGSPDLKLALSVAPRASDLTDSDRPTSRNKLRKDAWLSFHNRHRDLKKPGIGLFRSPGWRSGRTHSLSRPNSLFLSNQWCTAYGTMSRTSVTCVAEASFDRLCRLIWHRATQAPHDMMRPVDTTDRLPPRDMQRWFGSVPPQVGHGRWSLVAVVGPQCTEQS